jgi:O-antigen/teichoic acid export membrane protein
LKDDYKKKALEASAFIIIGFGLSQVIRLAGNLVLTRLLVPEIFGLLSTARIFCMALALFSDIGLDQAVIRSKRANDPDFLNTAWTLQLIRSVILSVLSMAIAFPAAHFYNEPMLKDVIPVVGLFGLICGFQSTSLIILNRELNQKMVTYIELTIQVVSLICMIIAAYFFRNIWALLVGDVVGNLIRTIWSHILNSSRPNRLKLERQSVHELLSFGKWILVSTAVMFLASQTDRLIVGKILGMAWFGVYSIAVNLSEMPKQVVGKLSGSVIYPLISKFSHLSPVELREKIRGARGKFLFPGALLIALFACCGDYVVLFLFDQRYKAAAWILPLLVIGMWPYILTSTVDGSLLAIGKPKYSAFGNSIKFLYMIVIVPLAYKLGGEFTVVIAIALNNIPLYIVTCYGLIREHLSQVKQDLYATMILLIATGVLLLIRIVAGLGLPGQAAFILVK